MFNLRTLHYYNDCIVSFLSAILNFTLIFLIHFKTTKELKPYSRMLLCTCFVDLFFTALVFLTKMEMEFSDGIFVFLLSGFFEKVSNPLFSIFIYIWIFGFWYCLTASPISFFYRYMLICRERTLSTSKLIFIYFIVSLIVSAYTATVVWAFPQESMLNDKYINMMNTEPWVDEYGFAPNFIASKMTDPAMIVCAASGLILAQVAYGLIIFFNIKIYRTLEQSKHLMSQRTKQLQKQLNWSLISQAVNPILTTTLPVIISITCAALRVKTQGLGLIVMSAISWMTVLNPLCTIIFVTHYRRAILKVFHINTSNGINPQNNSSSKRQQQAETNLPTVG